MYVDIVISNIFYLNKHFLLLFLGKGQLNESSFSLAVAE